MPANTPPRAGGGEVDLAVPGAARGRFESQSGSNVWVRKVDQGENSIKG